MKQDEKILADKAANLYRGFEVVGGRLKITSSTMIFTPHAVNIQTAPEEILISDIEKIEKGNTLFLIPNQMIVFLKSGKKHKFVVYGRSALIELLTLQMKKTKKEL